MKNLLSASFASSTGRVMERTIRARRRETIGRRCYRGVGATEHTATSTQLSSTPIICGLNKKCSSSKKLAPVTTIITYYYFYCSLNNVYIEWSSIFFLKDRQAVVQIQNRWCETVDPQIVEPQNRPPKCRAPDEWFPRSKIDGVRL